MKRLTLIITWTVVDALNASSQPFSKPDVTSPQQTEMHSVVREESHAGIESVAGYWSFVGNKGTIAGKNFLGTADNQPLEIKVHGQRALRMEPNTNGAPNIIGGASVNYVGQGTVGAVIGGGGSLNYNAGNGFKAWSNAVYANFSTIAGGLANLILTGADYSTIAGGWDNLILSNSEAAVVAGGFVNIIRDNSQESAIGGGQNNWIYDHSPYSTIAGGDFNLIEDHAWEATVSGGGGNHIKSRSSGCTIAGGNGNTIETNIYYSTISGGSANVITNSAANANIAGGFENTVGSDESVIGGGQDNVIRTNSYASIISGGTGNTIKTDSPLTTIGGGTGNSIGANAYASTISGGAGNAIINNAPYSVVPGGSQNITAGAYSLAAGRRATAYYGSFVWADGNDFDFAPASINQFAVRCTGGAAFISGIDVSGNPTAGVQLAAGSGSWSSLSDRNSKENFQAVDAKEVLARIATLPVTTWNYKTQDNTIRHLGPMAQDFYAAFNLGEDDKHITTVDESGVALAAIQGLNQKLEEQHVENAELKQTVVELKELVSKLSLQVETQLTNP